MLKDLVKNNPDSDFVFTIDGNPIHNKHLQKNWCKTLKNSNLKYRNFHTLRHTFATLLLPKGVNLVTVKELMGHSSVKTTEIYLSVLPADKSKSVQKLDAILN